VASRDRQRECLVRPQPVALNQPHSQDRRGDEDSRQRDLQAPWHPAETAPLRHRSRHDGHRGTTKHFFEQASDHQEPWVMRSRFDVSRPAYQGSLPVAVSDIQSKQRVIWSSKGFPPSKASAPEVVAGHEYGCHDDHGNREIPAKHAKNSEPSRSLPQRATVQARVGHLQVCAPGNDAPLWV